MSSNSVTEMDDEQFLRLLSSPVVAVLASDEANEICRKNGLTFVDLLKPFEQLEDKVSYKDPNGQTVDVINLRIDFRDLRRDHFLSPSALRPALWDIMRASKVPQVPLDSSEQFETSSEPSSWFLNYRYHLLKHLEPGNHEFIRCYVGCLFVVSTSEQNPKERINRLIQQQHSLQHQTGKHEVYGRSAEMYSMPKWFCPNIFKYYLLIHDVHCGGEEERAEQLFEEVKTSYGVNACHLLRINSLQASAVDVVPDYWSPMPPSLSSIAATFQEAPFSEVDDLDERKPACLPIDALGFSEENPFAGETIAHPLSEVNFRSVETEKATDAQLDMYGLNKAPARPGRCLTESDVARLKVFVNEFCTRGLVPYVERQLKFFNDVVRSSARGVRSLLLAYASRQLNFFIDVVSSRKGIGKSLLSATKKWLSGSSAPNLSSLVASSTAGSSGSTNGSDRPAGSPSGQGESIFASESWEMQGRRLADLAFLFQHYELAHQIYHMLRKELYAQQAWFNYAGACEMASLSGRLSGSRAYLGHYMDAAVSTYGDVCKTPWLAVRAALLSASLLCSSGHWIEAANQLVKVIDKDAVAGALFLEEAARCYYNVRMYRKAAFHLILAGNRFSKVPLRRHAVYAYERALRMYIGKQWKAAEAHIDLTLGQLYHSTKEHSAGVRTFERLFSLGASEVAVGQQRVAFSEYLTLLKLSNESKSRSDVPKLVLPKILDEQTVVYSCILPEEVGCYEESDQPACWASMEQSCASVAMAGHQFVPYACYRGQNWQAALPCKVPVNQTVMVKLHLSNPLNIPIGLTQARLLVTLSPHDGSEPKDDDVMVSSVDEYVLPAMASNALLVLTATPRKQGLLTIVGIAYCLCNVEEADSNGSVPLSNDCLWKFCQSSAVYGSQAVLVRGRRLNDTKEQRLGRFYATDTRLSMLVASEAPLLKFDLAYAAGKYFEDQIISAPIVVSNIGTLPVDRICICASSAANVAVTGASAASHPIGWKVVGGNVVYDVGGIINAGESINLTLWIRAVGGPTSAETNLLRVLFFWCCSTGATSEVKYRTFRWRAAYTVVPSVKASIQYKPLPHTYLPDVPVSRLLIVLSVLNWSQVCEMKLLAVGMQSTQGCRLQSLLSEARDYSLEPGQEETICCVSAKVSVRSDVASFSCLPLSPVEAEKAQLDGNNFLRGGCRFPANAVSSKPVISLFWSTSMARSDGTVVTLFGETSLTVDASPFGGSLSGKDPASDCDVINYALLYSPSISHDFSASRICRIPVELKLYNGSESETARIKVECIDRAGNDQSANSNVRDLIWAGTYRSSVSLEPKGEATVHLIAAATDTSVIDLKSGLRIVVDRSPYGEPYELTLQSHFITIHSLQAIGTVAEVK